MRISKAAIMQLSIPVPIRFANSKPFCLFIFHRVYGETLRLSNDNITGPDLHNNILLLRASVPGQRFRS